MKLAELLNNRSDLKKKIEGLKVRIQNNAKIQEGDEPIENPNELMTILVDAIQEYERVVALIHSINSRVTVDGKSLAGLLVQKEMLALKRNILNSIAENCMDKIQRFSLNQIKETLLVDVKSLQKQIDAISKEYRAVDTLIQEINWTTEI